MTYSSSAAAEIMKSLLLLSSLCLAGVSVDAQMHRGKNRTAAPVVLVKNENGPNSIAVDDDSVYWVSESRTTLKKVNKTGGTPTTLVTGQKNIRRIIADGESIYFNTDDEVRRVRKTGGDPATLVAFVDAGGAESTYFYLALDEKNVYFVNSPPTGAEQIMKVSKSGGKPVILGSVYVPTGLAADGAGVYWTNPADDTVKRVNREGGPAVTVGECENPVAVAVDSTSVYCSRREGQIMRFGKTNGTVTTLATFKDADFDRIAVDDRSVYALNILRGIYRIDKNGRPPVRLVRLDRDSTNFTIDASSIYWTNYFQGTVMRRGK